MTTNTAGPTRRSRSSGRRIKLPLSPDASRLLRLLLVLGIAAAFMTQAEAQSCPPPYKEAAGACVQSCPGGYEDTGRTCVYRRQGGGAT